MTEFRCGGGTEATARRAAIVEGSEDPIIGYTLNGVITDWNQAATRLYGFSAEEAIGHDLSITVPPTSKTKQPQRSEHSCGWRANPAV